ncbi:MAG: helix-turn-helix transcriptional regulator [Treponema sp.]|nr:helix-turn-helix transcriptional regulator [Treponema sp.]
MEEVNIRKIFGENVKYYRKKLGLSQEQLAERLEISTNHLSVIETGTKFVTYKLLEKMVCELQVLPATLFYTSSSIESDESKVNKINLIIDDELNSTSSRIHNRLREIL